MVFLLDEFYILAVSEKKVSEGTIRNCGFSKTNTKTPAKELEALHKTTDNIYLFYF